MIDSIWKIGGIQLVYISFIDEVIMVEQLVQNLNSFKAKKSIETRHYSPSFGKKEFKKNPSRESCLLQRKLSRLKSSEDHVMEMTYDIGQRR